MVDCLVLIDYIHGIKTTLIFAIMIYTNLVKFWYILFHIYILKMDTFI